MQTPDFINIFTSYGKKCMRPLDDSVSLDLLHLLGVIFKSNVVQISNENIVILSVFPLNVFVFL